MAGGRTQKQHRAAERHVEKVCELCSVRAEVSVLAGTRYDAHKDGLEAWVRVRGRERCLSGWLPAVGRSGIQGDGKAGDAWPDRCPSHSASKPQRRRPDAAAQGNL